MKILGKKIFYLPAIAVTLFFGMLAFMMGNFSIISGSVIFWIAMFVLAGALLNAFKWFGALVGMVPGVYMLWLGIPSGNTTQIALGCIVIAFYIWSIFHVKNLHKILE